MNHPIKLIVGLGNPGAEYHNTRHNAGAWFIENLVDAENIALRLESKFKGLYGKMSLDNNECHLLIPTTFMNLAGASVIALAHFYKIPPEAILVAHDELDLPVGTVRLKFDGGHGGHNGLRDIIEKLGTPKFHRLRIGIDRPAPQRNVADYVLNKPSLAEKSEIDRSIEEAATYVPDLLAGNLSKCTQKLHTKTPGRLG